ncbi:MAG: hypothetical protein IKI04_03260, partial [Bacilli bacterium]|nr:hypothetical protein [Bacilli bacterium]
DNESSYVRYYINNSNALHPNYYCDKKDANNKCTFLSPSDYMEKYPNTKLTNRDDLINDALAFLEKGDIVALGFGDNGHTGMVYSVSDTDIMIIDNNGYLYNDTDYIERFEDGGSINITNFKEWLMGGEFYKENPDTWKGDIAFIKILNDDDDDESNSHYLNYDSNGINAGGITISNQPNYKASVIRSKYKDLEFDKTYEITYDDCSTTKSLYAGIGSKITYGIDIKNHGNKAYTVESITENIDTSKVDYISSTGATSGYSNGKITFSNISVPANGNVTLTYTVKVKNDDSLIDSVVVTNGMVDNLLPLKEIQIKIDTYLNNYQKSRIIDNYGNYSGSSTNGIEYINNLYNGLFNKQLNLSDGIISYDDDSSYLVKNTKINKNSNIVVGNLYGLKIAASDSPQDNIIDYFKAWRRLSYNADAKSWVITGLAAGNISDLGEYVNRSRILLSDMLETGDVILTNGVMYLYINNNNTPKLIKNGTVSMSGSSVNSFLLNLVGDNYVVLRPALGSFPRSTRTITYNKNTTDTVTNMPDDTTYTYSTIQGCTITLSDKKPVREGYTFKGWIQGNNVWQASTIWNQSNDGNYELLAKWEENTSTDINLNVTNDLLKDDTNMIIMNKYLPFDTTISSFMNKLTSDSTITITDNTGNSITGRLTLRTGDIITISNGVDTSSYTIMIKGDIDNNGNINLNDVKLLASYI